MLKYGTEISIIDKSGAPFPDPVELNVLNAGRTAASEQTKITFTNNTAKSVKITLNTTAFFETNEFEINPNQKQKVINLKRDSPKGKVNYNLCYENEAPPNEEPAIIIDPEVGG